MTTLKRAKPWEISDSEGEGDYSENKVAITRTPAPKTDNASYSDSSSRKPEEANGSHTGRCSPVSESSETLREEAEVGLVPPAPPAGRQTPSPWRRRRTREEIEADRMRAEERKAAREKQRQERERAREEKRQEQQRKRETAERLKSFRPENYLKHLTVRVHPVLLQDAGSDVLLGTLAGLEWRSSVEIQDLSHSISWTREQPPTEDDDAIVEEEQVLMVISLTEFMDMMVSAKQTLQGYPEEAGSVSLFQSLCEYLNRSPERVVTVLVTGTEQNSRPSAAGHGDLQDFDIEEVLVYLQLYKSVSVHFLFGWQEVTDHVCAVTKALSKRPFKKLTEQAELGFCVDGSWAGGVRAERDGSGLRQVWTRQIQQLNRVSVAMATAVTTSYPSPQLLLQAYEKVESEGERRGLLADLPVRGGAKERRVGPELSIRIHRLFTTQNPQLVLD
ncbi:essential meiotic structure-specific endonuclease subunit 2 [Chanos chanos]|uniref:Essential meiotic structure-specific endonuclease subunit 2 n=1 Tax=Chanos chanos TaxID=29144 RepID=A0A6J2V1D9_CHACN|nr:probable crossover junction endonuclease EME2 [Chanos chanos]